MVVHVGSGHDEDVKNLMALELKIQLKNMLKSYVKEICFKYELKYAQKRINERLILFIGLLKLPLIQFYFKLLLC